MPDPNRITTMLDPNRITTMLEEANKESLNDQIYILSTHCF